MKRIAKSVILLFAAVFVVTSCSKAQQKLAAHI